MPDANDAFTVLSAGSLTGFFDNATPGSRLDTVDGLGSFLVDIDFGLDQIVLSNFMPNVTADFDNDGDVDGIDFLLIQRNDISLISLWQQQYGTSSNSITAVPEPSALALALLCSIVASALRRAVVSIG